MAAVSPEAKARVREYHRAYMGAMRAADPEALRRKQREAYAADPEKGKAKVRAWRAKLPPEVAKERARRIRLKQFYGIDRELPIHFDLVVNTDVLSPESESEVVAAAARR